MSAAQFVDFGTARWDSSGLVAQWESVSVTPNALLREGFKLAFESPKETLPLGSSSVWIGERKRQVAALRKDADTASQVTWTSGTE